MGCVTLLLDKTLIHLNFNSNKCEKQFIMYDYVLSILPEFDKMLLNAYIFQKEYT